MTPEQKSDAFAGCAKAAIIVGVALAALIVAIVAGSFFWFRSHKTEILQSAQSSSTEGSRDGRSTDASGCVEKAVERLRTGSGLTHAVTCRFYLKACLPASRPSAGFCEQVPKTGELFRRGAWEAEQCRRRNLPGSGCSQLFEEVVEFCGKTPPARAPQPD